MNKAIYFIGAALGCLVGYSWCKYKHLDKECKDHEEGFILGREIGRCEGYELYKKLNEKTETK